MRHTVVPSIFRTFSCRATLKRRTKGWSRRFGSRRHHNRKEMPFGHVRKISKSDPEFRHVYTSAWNNSVPTGRIVMKYIWLFVPKSFEKKFKFHYNPHFWSHLAHFFLEWEKFQTEVVHKIETHILCSVTFPPKIEPFMGCGKILYSRAGPQMTIWRIRIACWIPKVTNAHLEYVTLIAFPLQQLLHERASM
jgi:hypothetical protein